MNKFLSGIWRNTDRSREAVDEVSADLPYELQSKMFDQLATVSIAAVGFSVTLLGSVLKDVASITWIVVILFGMAGFTAIVGNNHLIDGLHQKERTRPKARKYTMISLGLITFGTGILSSTIYINAEHSPSKTANANGQT